jgi:hypothetical protein
MIGGRRVRGMFCHRKFFFISNVNGGGWNHCVNQQILLTVFGVGVVLSQQNLSMFWKWGQTVCPPPNLGTFYHKSNWDMLSRGTVCPGDISSRGRLVKGTVRPGDGTSRGCFVQGTLCPGDSSLQKSRGRIVTGTDHVGTLRQGTYHSTPTAPMSGKLWPKSTVRQA